jgi:hypothetical protein
MPNRPPKFKQIRRKGKTVLCNMQIIYWRNKRKLDKILEGVEKLYEPEESKPKEEGKDPWQMFK